MTTLHDFGGALGWPLDTFLLGSHNFMVTALGLKVALSVIIIQKKECHGWRKGARFEQERPKSRARGERRPNNEGKPA